MNEETLKGLFTLFHLNEKSDEQIMKIMKARHNTKEACTLGISFLKSEDNILATMQDAFFEDCVCEAGIKALHLENKSENEILAFVEKAMTGNDSQKSVVKKLCIPYFKLDKKKEYQIFNLLKKTKYEYWIRKASVEVLEKRVKKMTDEELLSLIELADYNEDIFYLCIRHFKSEEQILTLLEREQTSDHVRGVMASHIKWEGKDENQVLEVMKRAHYQSSFCEAGISFLKQEENILFAMEKGHYYGSICKIGIPLLQLESKSNNDFLRIMLNSKYNHLICDKCLSFLNLSEKTEQGIMDIIKVTEYNQFVCMEAITFLKSANLITFVIKKTNFQTGVCCAGLPLLKLSTDIHFVMNGSDYDTDVCSIGILLLKTEEEIFSIMEKTKFNSGVCEAGVKTMEAIKLAVEKKNK